MHLLCSIRLENVLTEAFYWQRGSGLVTLRPARLVKDRRSWCRLWCPLVLQMGALCCVWLRRKTRQKARKVRRFSRCYVLMQNVCGILKSALATKVTGTRSPPRAIIAAHRPGIDCRGVTKKFRWMLSAGRMQHLVRQFFDGVLGNFLRASSSKRASVQTS
jgi:hypothetical protein